MSTFKVTIETIEKIWAHPNADRLELASVEGMLFQFCVPKNKYKVGDQVVYFPVDSVLPQNLIERFGIANFLTGKEKNRLKTVKLRDQISQGFVCKVNDIVDLLPIRKESNGPFEVMRFEESLDDISPFLGVTKYDPPEILCKAGNLVKHPDGVYSYDIEGCQRYPQVLNRLMKLKVCVTEKIEGSNHYTTIMPDGEIIVGQRNYQIKPIEDLVHDWWKAAETYKHFDILKDYQSKNPGKQVTIRSEICGPGIQDNIYKLKKTHLFAFDVSVNGKYLDPADFQKFCNNYGLDCVPTIGFDVTLEEWLAGKTVEQASHGKSHIGDVLREGIVIKPMIEQTDADLDTMGGRLFLKMRDPIYLDKFGK